MRGRKRKLPVNYVPPPYINSSDNEDQLEPPVQRQREVLQQQERQGHQLHDENMWIDIDNDLFMSDGDEPEAEVPRNPDEEVRPAAERGGDAELPDDAVVNTQRGEDAEPTQAAVVDAQRQREHGGEHPEAADHEADEPHAIDDEDDDYVSSDEENAEQGMYLHLINYTK